MSTLWNFILKILDLLEIDDYTARNTRERVKKIQGNPDKARKLLKDLDKKTSQGNCFVCGNRYYCAILKACIYCELRELDSALAQAKTSTRDFTLNGSIWNETIAMWLYGELLLFDKKETQARAILGKTIKNFKYLAQKHHNYDNYAQYKKATEAIAELKQQLEEPNILSRANFITKESTHRKSARKYQRRTPWKPTEIIFQVHSQITAGRAGDFIFDSDSSLNGRFEEIVFDETPHQIYNTVSDGDLVIINPKVHRWFQVNGESMNKSTPIPIENKDYVLAIDVKLSNQQAVYGDIVVAEIYAPDSEQQSGVIKKYTRQGLLSLSTEEFPVIPLGRVNIRGVVIAVAKPCQASPDDEIRYELEDALAEGNPRIETLFANLMTKALHDKETVIRLIWFEREKAPTEALEDLMQRAIERWINDLRP